MDGAISCYSILESLLLHFAERKLMKLPYLQLIFIKLLFPALMSVKSLVLWHHKGLTERPSSVTKAFPCWRRDCPQLTCPTWGFCLPDHFPHGTKGSLEARRGYGRDPENTELFTQLRAPWRQPEAAFWPRLVSGIGQMLNTNTQHHVPAGQRGVPITLYLCSDPTPA